MSLENEYFQLNAELKAEEKNLAKFEELDTNNMTEEQLQARERGIRGVNDSIKEIKELIEEVKEELNDFIKNGGEVSEKTKEAIGYFEPIRIDFDVSSANSNVYYDGYVTINDEEAEDVDWTYYYPDGTTSYEHQVIIHKDEEITGLTPEQSDEIQEFIDEETALNEWITDVILQSEEDENRTYKKGNIIVKINDGAKFEIKYKDYNSLVSFNLDYYMAFELYFNGQKVFLDSDVYFEDPYTYEQFEVGKDILFENGAYIVEIPKCWWEDPEEVEMKKEIIKEYKDAFEEAYVKSLVRDLGVFGTAYNFIKEQLRQKEDMKVFDESYLQDWANATEDDFEEYDVYELYFITSDDVEKIIKEDYKEELKNQRDAQRDYELEQKELEDELKREFGY